MPDTALRSVDAVTEARVHLAAALRLATLHELEEGIDNHFTMSVPGREGRYLILPFGLHWSEARASVAYRLTPGTVRAEPRPSRPSSAITTAGRP